MPATLLLYKYDEFRLVILFLPEPQNWACTVCSRGTFWCAMPRDTRGASRSAAAAHVYASNRACPPGPKESASCLFPTCLPRGVQAQPPLFVQGFCDSIALRDNLYYVNLERKVFSHLLNRRAEHKIAASAVLAVGSLRTSQPGVFVAV